MQEELQNFHDAAESTRAITKCSALRVLSDRDVGSHALVAHVELVQP